MSLNYLQKYRENKITQLPLDTANTLEFIKLLYNIIKIKSL